MTTVKFLTASTECPREAGVKELMLPVPDPGMNEYRRYYNHRMRVSESESGNIEEPCADYVAVISDHNPTEEEWSLILSENNINLS